MTEFLQHLDTYLVAWFMDIVLLFCKQTPLTDDRLPWLRGLEEHPWAAHHSTCSKG